MKSFLFSIFIISFTFNANAQVGVGTVSPDASSILDISSINGGLLIPRIDLTSSTDTVTIASPATSLLVYNTGLGGLSPAGYYYFNGTSWVTLAGSGGTDWTLTGNSGTSAGTNFIGTADAVDLRIKTGGSDRLNISNTNGQLQSYTTSGSAVTPSYSFSGTQTSTGMFNPTTDNLGFATAGTEKVRIQADGDVGIGATPNATAKLEINATDRGLLIPNVALLATNNGTLPIASPATSLLVYNTATAGVSPNNVVPGYYYWDGVWIPLATGTLTNDWSILGNTNIVDGTNFMGTGLLTNVDVAFKRNGLAAGKIGATSTSFGVGALTSGAASNSTAFGTNALNVNVAGTNNVAVGNSALISNTAGTDNTALGFSALRDTRTILANVGTSNTAVGSNAMLLNTTASGNTAVGASALRTNTTGTGNNAFGLDALRNTTGSGNSAFGTNALRSNSTGTNNTAIGSTVNTLSPLAAALGVNTTGANNTAVGAGALAANTTGNNNIAIGTITTTPMAAALALNTTGANNTAVGSGALAANTATSNNTAIGFQALAANASGLIGAAQQNTAVGASALVANTLGLSNVALGFNAGSNITTGSSNIMIGASAAAPVATGSSQLNIGNTIFGNMTGVPLTLGVNTTRTIGINVLSPQGALDITSSTEGLLIPRVALADTATVTVLTGTTSEIVYNTFTSAIGPNQVTPGFYYLSTNTGPWVRFNTGALAGWSTTGNSGLTAGTNFLGTTDAVDVSFKRSNTAAGFIGADSTAFGVSSLAANAGTNNTAFGTNALAANNSPGDNTAIGFNALAANTLNSGAGNLNTAVGSGALDSLNGGARNTAVGANALTGVNGNASLDNVAVGWNALQGSGTIDQSVAIGAGAFLNSGSGTTRSTAIGYNAGNGMTQSIENVIIGWSAQGSGATARNQIVIGAGATAVGGAGDNTVTLGNGSITALRCQVTSITGLSDRRDKADIVTLAEGVEFIKKLKPVSYTWNTRDKSKVGIKAAGFIAQDLLDLQQKSAIGENLDLVTYNNPDRLEARYGNLLPVIVKGIQEQQEEIEALKKANAELIKTNEAILKRLEALEKK